MLTEKDYDREWTRQELREYARSIGFDVADSEIIPQGVKFIAPPGELTPSDLAAADRVIAVLGRKLYGE